MNLREAPPLRWRIAASATCVTVVILVWAAATHGTPERRFVSPAVLSSPGETFLSLGSLWFDRALSRNVFLSLWRVLEGFGLALVIGVPLGVLCGTLPWLGAFFAPITIFGRNVPMSALVPLTLLWFGIDETQKIMFIFVSCVAFVVFDAARSIAEVDDKYVQTAKTLGASKWQVVYKVLVPLALPNIFGSMRLLFGIAFGYIILAEMVNMTGGVGDLILTSQRQGPREHVYLLLIIISVVAYGLDRLLLLAERKFFPYKGE